MSKGTLVENLDSRIKSSPRFRDTTVREYFRRSTLRWWRPVSSDHHEQERDIVEWLGDRKFQSSLEIGPGFGRITSLIAPQSQLLTLVEINNRAAKRLASEFPKAVIVNDAVENYRLWQGKYDLVVAIAVLMHIPNIPCLLETISETLISGGELITSIVPVSFYTNKRSVIHRGIDPQELEQAFKETGLRIKGNTQRDRLLTYILLKE